jgi:hypothetical protein
MNVSLSLTDAHTSDCVWTRLGLVRHKAAARRACPARPASKTTPPNCRPARFTTFPQTAWQRQRGFEVPPAPGFQGNDMFTLDLNLAPPSSNQHLYGPRTMRTIAHEPHRARDPGIPPRLGDRLDCQIPSIDSPQKNWHDNQNGMVEVERVEPWPKARSPDLAKRMGRASAPDTSLSRCQS